MHICMYICTHIYIYLCIHIRECVYIHAFIHFLVYVVFHTVEQPPCGGDSRILMQKLTRDRLQAWLYPPPQGPGLCGWLSSLWSPLGSPKYSVPYYTKDPRRDHSFDNHPCGEFS